MAVSNETAHGANATDQVVSRALVEYFRCPPELAPLEVGGSLSRDSGYFTFTGSTCFGRLAGARPVSNVGERMPAGNAARAHANGHVRLPFDLSEVVTNLRQERYRSRPIHVLERLTSIAAARGLYYFLRPALSVAVRKQLQKVRLSGWERIVFPRWPVDFTVETLMEATMALLLKSGDVERIPFIWFWPDGATSCVVMTHDVEGAAGLGFCDELMDLDDRYRIKSAFQLIPEIEPQAWWSLAERLRPRGFEVNIHDFNHDGHLFRSRRQFLDRAARINQYARDRQCRGFRSGAMYRQQQWYGAFEFAYDMSVPNVAHLEPQRGGCCTVMPYFVGPVLELPLTTLQDYSLFHILGDYSIALWTQQIDEIMARNGLLMFLTHPDYLLDSRALQVYRALLAHLDALRQERRLWFALPAEVDRWWRSRQQMTLVPDGDAWRIEGSGSHRARVAFATLQGDEVVYQLADAA